MTTALSSPEQSLGLEDGTFSSSPPEHAFETLVQTIIDELSPSVTPLSLNEFLQHAGYTGPHDDRQAIKSFLLSSLQAHRMSNHLTNDSSSSSSSSPQERLCASLTRILHAMDTPPPRLESNSLWTIIDHITQQLSASQMSTVTSSNLQTPILSQTDRSSLMDSDASRLQLASKILAQLQKEQVTRIGLLLTRLQVTTLSFSRSLKAQQSPQLFSALSRRSQALQSNWTHPQPISMFEAVTARNYLLVENQLRAQLPEANKTSKVKDFVMGSVPDRGGRIAERLEMPQFQERTDVVNTSNRKNHDGYRKKASGKRARRR